ncbi:MAG TPA: BTAD domain-containing putative transcriptional regulator [Jatrophihabitantaceae bacterium]|nr:BTAD domain-containing putative transcriptional regulator [Jatrophihabitantaceae bacterium]
MWFGVLGRLEARDDAGGPVRIGGSVRRELLAALLCRSGDFVSAADLIEDLWGELPPRTAAKTLQSHMARLRDDLGRPGGAVVVTEGAGYRVDLTGATLDARTFECEIDSGLAAFRRGDDRLAISHLDDALALWRGDAYLDFANSSFALTERMRLAELRAMARETRTDAALRLGEAATLVSELEQRIRREPYRERSWEQLILALYRSGRQADALAALRMARDRLATDLGVDPGPGLRALEMRVLEQDPTLLADDPKDASPDTSSVQDAIAGRCPYRGLGGYGTDDAAVFVGRERLTALLTGRLAESSVVVVAGASGSGKSSVVRAGVVPALRAGALPDSAAWRVVVTTPTDGAGAVTGADVLVLDQAEEMFSVLDDDDRADLLNRLHELSEYGGTRLVIVIRGDFFGMLADVPWLARRAQRDTVLVGRMRDDELARVVAEPARRAGVQVDDDVVDTILDEAAGQAQPLPLVSVALVRAWEQRDGANITLDGYRASGGLIGAIETMAEATYARLPDDLKVEAQRLLVRMATREDAAWVRKPLPREAATSIASATVVDVLADARLITVTESRIELSHDALLEQWPRLRGWLDERVIAAGMLEHLAVATTAWQASARDDADLYRGVRLQAARDWVTDHPSDVNQTETEFLATSEALEQRTLRSARRSARRLRALVAGLAVLLLVAVAGGVIALDQRSVARRQVLRAEVSRMATLAATLPDDQRDLSLLLAAQSNRLQSTDQTAGALQAALMNTPSGLDRIIRYPSPSVYPHLDHTGRLLAVPGADGSLTVYDVISGRVLRAFTWSSPLQFAVFSGDDHLVAAGGLDGNVVVYDLSTGRRLGQPLRMGGGVAHPVFDPRDDNRLYVISSHGGLKAWDRSDPEHPRTVGAFYGIESTASGQSAAFLTVSPDGKLLAASAILTGFAGGSLLQIWDAHSGKKLVGINGQAGAFAGGANLALGFGNDTVLMNSYSGRFDATVRGTGGGPYPIVSPDGRRIAISEKVGTANAVSVYDLRTRHRIGQPLVLHRSNAVYALGFLPDGRVVTTGTGEAAVWRIGADDLPPLGIRLHAEPGHPPKLPQVPWFLSGVDPVLTFGGDGSVLLHDPKSGRVITPLLNGAVSGPITSSPDGRMILGYRVKGGGLAIWDRRSQAILATLPGTVDVSQDAIFNAQWSERGDRVAADVGGVGYIWNVSDPTHPTTPKKVGVPQGGVLDDLVFTPDGHGLVTASLGFKRLALIDVANGRTRWEREVGDIDLRQFAVSPDGKTVAFHSGDDNAGVVTLLDAATGKTNGSISVPSNGGVGYLNGGKWLVISSNDPRPQAQLYNAVTRQPFGIPFPTAASDQDPLIVDPSGNRFSEILDQFGNNDLAPESLEPFLWNVEPGSWVTLACTIAGRNLTRAEWHQYLPDRSYERTCAEWPAGS